MTQTLKTGLDEPQLTEKELNFDEFMGTMGSKSEYTSFLEVVLQEV